MEQAASLVNLDQQQNVSEQQTVGSLTEQHIERLWIRMGSAYGHKWESSYGAKDDGTWLAGLQGLMPQQLADGLNAVAQSGAEWPPSLPEFRTMCEGKEKNGFGLDYIPQCYQKQAETSQVKLANPATEQTRKKAMADCKKILGSA